jgi:iron(III) transport system substrate-binding protein
MVFIMRIKKVLPQVTRKMMMVAVTIMASTYCSTVLAAADVVNVYSARKEALIKPILDTFSEQSGIKVNLITGKADALLTRLRLEGRASPADVFVTVDAGRLHRAKAAGVLQVTDSQLLQQAIPENLRDSDGYWFGLSQRARPIFYVKGQLDPKVLSTYEALADEQWKGRVCMRSSNNVYNQSLVASMFTATGKAATQSWLNTFVTYFARPPAGGDIDQLKALAAGLCDVTIANTYYFGRLLNSELEAERELADKLAIFWPNQQDRGAHVNVSGAGITAHAKHPANARKLIEFLVSDEAQAWYSAVNNEYPVVKGAVISPTLKAWGEFKQDTVDLSQLGLHNRTAVEMMDRAGWK